MHSFSTKEVCQLLYNKFVVVLGDSIQRSVYKDLVRLLQTDSLLTTSQMKAKGELHFQNDHLIEGGVVGGLHNGTHYREVRQYRTGHHLVRFYFLTRVYSAYLESILNDFQAGPPPDVLILNSCVWDVSRYGLGSMKEYRTNLEMAFNRLDAVLPSSCLVIWNMTMPLGRKVSGGFLIPELQHLSKTLRKDIIEGNFYGATLAGFHLFDVVDLHYHFRHDLGNRVKDGIHWNNLVHRRITNLLLAHIADAWGVVMAEKKPQKGLASREQPTVPLDLQPASPPLLFPGTPQSLPGPPDIHRPCPGISVFQDDTFFLPGNEGSPQAFAGFTSFEDTRLPPVHPDGLKRGGNSTVAFDFQPAPPALLPPGPPQRLPEPSGVHRTFLNFSVFQDDAFFLPGNEGSPQAFAGFTSFEDTHLPPVHPDGLKRGGNSTVAFDFQPAPPALLPPGPPQRLPEPSGVHRTFLNFSVFQDDAFFLPGNEGSPQAFAGFTSFEDTHLPPVHPDGLKRGGNSTVAFDFQPAPPALLPPGPPQRLPEPSGVLRTFLNFSVFQDDAFFLPGNEGSPQAFAGFTSFEDTHLPPVHPDGLKRGGNSTVAFDFQPAPPALLPPGPPQRLPEPSGVHRTFLNFSVFQDDAFFLPGNEGSPQAFAGFTSFEDTHLPPVHPDGVLNNFHPFEEAGRGLFTSYPSHNVENIPPRSSRRHRRGHHVVEHHHGLVMRHPAFHVRDTSPYRRNRHVTYRCY